MANAPSNRPLLIVSGSSGLIGSKVVKEFGRDHEVIGLDTKPPAGEHRPAAFIECDLTSDGDTARAFERVRREHGDTVACMIHLAAYYDFSGEPSPMYRSLTVEGTRRVLRQLQQFERVEQFVFTSSLLVMEPTEPEEGRLTEASPLEDEPWDYPRSKIEAERVIRREHGDVPAVILRVAGVYDEDGNSIPIGQHIARIYEKRIESYLFPGDADHGTPYLHLSDLMTCFRHVVERRARLDDLALFLIAEPNVMSYNDLQDAIGTLIHGKEWPTIRIPKAAAKAGAWVKERTEGEEAFIKPWMVDLADADYTVAIRHAADELDWRPGRSLADTLPVIVGRMLENPTAWYEANGLPLPDELKSERQLEPASRAGRGGALGGRWSGGRGRRRGTGRRSTDE